ncbi:MAG: enoyl-CoA hydratase [Chloroflexi bacterium]|nr:enoyl-CoA hydratase [Chloroflexota bacterium]
MAREYENLLIDRVGTDGRIARVTLNRPEKMNALSQELLFEFRDALEDLEADDSARVLVVRGAGRTFSAGYDLTPAQRTGADAIVRAFRMSDEKGRRLWQGVRAGMQRITNIHMYFWNLQKITIAQVHGYAIAGGCELSMMADLVTCANDARFGHPGLRFAGTRTSMILPLLIGMRKAKELFYTGDNITGEEAARIGMANFSCPVEQLEERTLALAERIAILPADHLAMLKIHMNRFHENMGIYSSVHASTDLDAAGTFTSQSYTWSDKMREGGLKDALAWRDGPYADYRSAVSR